MSTNFPTSLDTFTNPTGSNPLTSPDHAGQHTNANDALAALETKVGADSSAVTTSIDYLLKNTSSSNPGHTHTVSAITGVLPETKGGTNQSTYTKGDVLAATGTNTLGKLPVGTDAQVLSADSTKSTGLNWVSLPASKLFASASNVTISGTTSETNLISQTVTGGTLSTANVIRGDVWIQFTNVANTNTCTLRLKYGGTTIATLVLTANSTSDASGHLMFTIQGAGTTGTQECSATLLGDSLTTKSVQTAQNGTSSIDSTANQTFLLTGQSNNSVANIIMNSYAITLDK